MQLEQWSIQRHGRRQWIQRPAAAGPTADRRHGHWDGVAEGGTQPTTTEGGGTEDGLQSATRSAGNNRCQSVSNECNFDLWVTDIADTIGLHAG